MQIQDFVAAIGVEFYAGVPDSQLKALCGYLCDMYGDDPRRHITAANEGNAAALAAGYHLATGKLPAVYMQNSGEGNIINPAASLLHRKVYGIPCLFIIGWRGEPGVHDEPQHIYQGEVTLQLLEGMGIPYRVVDGKTQAQEIREQMEGWAPWFSQGNQAALVIRKGALQEAGKAAYGNAFQMCREEVIRRIVEVTGEDILVSTTGKASRELYELREASPQGHGHDFLTVGSMGHASSIALGIALQKPDRRIWCLDGDGAALMHMGAMAVIGANRPQNLVHILLNNEAHETVGGMPTVSGALSWTGIAKACGYVHAKPAQDYGALGRLLAQAKAARELTFIEACCQISSRADLGRPAASPQENKKQFMRCLEQDAGRPNTQKGE